MHQRHLAEVMCTRIVSLERELSVRGTESQGNRVSCSYSYSHVILAPPAATASSVRDIGMASHAELQPHTEKLGFSCSRCVCSVLPSLRRKPSLFVTALPTLSEQRLTVLREISNLCSIASPSSPSTDEVVASESLIKSPQIAIFPAGCMALNIVEAFLGLRCSRPVPGI